MICVDVVCVTSGCGTSASQHIERVLRLWLWQGLGIVFLSALVLISTSLDLLFLNSSVISPSFLSRLSAGFVIRFIRLLVRRQRPRVMGGWGRMNGWVICPLAGNTASLSFLQTQDPARVTPSCVYTDDRFSRENSRFLYSSRAMWDSEHRWWNTNTCCVIRNYCWILWKHQLYCQCSSGRLVSWSVFWFDWSCSPVLCLFYFCGL